MGTFACCVRRTSCSTVDDIDAAGIDKLDAIVVGSCFAEPPTIAHGHRAGGRTGRGARRAGLLRCQYASHDLAGSSTATGCLRAASSQASTLAEAEHGRCAISASISADDAARRGRYRRAPGLCASDSSSSPMEPAAHGSRTGSVTRTRLSHSCRRSTSMRSNRPAPGDAFMAAIIARLIASGWATLTIDDVRYASAAGALTTTREGAIDSLPTSAEIQAFLDAQRGLSLVPKLSDPVAISTLRLLHSLVRHFHPDRHRRRAADHALAGAQSRARSGFSARCRAMGHSGGVDRGTWLLPAAQVVATTSITPSEAINIRLGGLTVHGAIVGGAVRALALLPASRPALSDLGRYRSLPRCRSGQAIGRWGNWANQEAFGRSERSAMGGRDRSDQPASAIRGVLDVSPNLSLRVDLRSADRGAADLGRANDAEASASGAKATRSGSTAYSMERFALPSRACGPIV